MIPTITFQNEKRIYKGEETSNHCFGITCFHKISLEFSIARKSSKPLNIKPNPSSSHCFPSSSSANLTRTLTLLYTSGSQPKNLDVQKFQFNFNSIQFNSAKCYLISLVEKSFVQIYIIPSLLWKCLGEPFTECRGREKSDPVTYSETTCLLFLLYVKLCNECKCFPSYIDQMNTYNKRSLGCGTVFKHNTFRIL